MERHRIRALVLLLALVAALMLGAFCIDRYGFAPRRRAIEKEMARPLPKMTEQFSS